MLKVFYLGGSPVGTLRAVLEIEMDALASTQKFVYLGTEFPKAETEAATIIEVPRNQRWKAGYYRAEKPPVEFEEILQAVG